MGPPSGRLLSRDNLQERVGAEGECYKKQSGGTARS